MKAEMCKNEVSYIRFSKMTSNYLGDFNESLYFNQIFSQVIFN